MDIKTLYEKHIYNLMCCFFIISASSLSVNIITGAVLNEFILVITALIFTTVSAFIISGLSAKKMSLYVLSVFVTGIVIASLFAVTFFFNIPVAETLNNSFKWLLYGSDENELHEIYYALISILIIEAILSLLIYTLIRFYHIRFVIGIISIIIIIILGIFEYTVSDFVVFFVFCYLISVFCETIIKHKKEKYKYAVSFLLPFLIVAGLLTTVFPSSETPIQWIFVKNIVKNVEELAYNIGNSFITIFNSESIEFNINMTGYSENGDFQGALTESDKEALQITQKIGQSKSIYLTGTVMDVYTGTGWKRSDSNNENSLNEYELDFLETLYAFYKYGLFNSTDEDVYEVPFSVREIAVSYRNINTKSLFYPLKTISITTNLPVIFSESSLFFEKIVKSGSDYRIKYMDINYGGELVFALLKNGDTSLYDEVVFAFELYSFAVKQLGGLSLKKIPDNFIDILKTRQKNIYQRYTELPNSVGQDVHLLAQKITENYDNDYEKMLALENFLSSYKYTLTPPVLASDELVSWFLFETGEGYCTYFATALAVMARTLGIPTRYVQGYATNFNEKIDSGTYLIRDSSAHAWVEAYISGVGWVPFEAVPSYATYRYAEWELKRREVKPVDVENEPIIPNAEEIREEVTEDYLEQLLLEKQLEEERLAKENRNMLFSFLIIAIALVLATSAGVVITIMLNLRSKRKKMDKLDKATYYLEVFKMLMLLLQILEHKPDKGETLTSFANRISVENDCSKFNKVFPVYQKVKYGNNTPSIEEFDDLLKYRDELAKIIKSKSRAGYIKYIMTVLK